MLLYEACLLGDGCTLNFDVFISMKCSCVNYISVFLDWNS